LEADIPAQMNFMKNLMKLTTAMTLLIMTGDEFEDPMTQLHLWHLVNQQD
jgi:hypothetical protein